MAELKDNPVTQLTEYELRNLVEHLETSGRSGDLHHLLRLEWTNTDETPYAYDNAWYSAREGVGQTDGYLSDVTRAWRLAETEYTNLQSPLSIGLQCRYALIIASLNSLVSNIPAALLIALVKEGMWTPAKGLAYARQMPNLAQRAKALVGLTDYMMGVEQSETFQEAITTIQAIQDENLRANTLIKITPHLPKTLLEEILIPVVRTLRSPNNRTIALTELALPLPELAKQDLLREAVEVAQEIGSLDDRVGILVWLAPKLPDDLKQQAVEKSLVAAQAISDAYNRAETLLTLALDHLPDQLKEIALQEASAATQKIESKGRQADALASLIPHLPEKLLDEAWATVWELEDYRFGLFLHLVSRLPEAWLRKALAIVDETPYESHRIEGLTTLLPRLAQLGCWQEAQSKARSIKQKDWRAKTLVRISVYMPEPERAEIIQEALAIAREIQTPEEQGQEFIQTGFYRRENTEGDYATERMVQALAEVGIHLSEPERTEVLQEALTIAGQIRRSEARAKTVAEIVLHLPESEHRAKELDRIVWAAEWGEKLEPSEFIAFARMSLRLPEQERETGFRAALKMVAKISSKEDQGKILKQLIPYLPEPLFVKALEIAKGIKDISTLTEILTVLAPKLPESLLHEAAIQAWKSWTRYNRSDEAFSVLAPHLPKPFLQEFLELAQKIGDEPQGFSVPTPQLKTLTALISHLVELNPQKAIELVNKPQFLNYRAKLLLVLVPQLLKKGLVSEAQIALRQMLTHKRYIIPMEMSELIPHLSEPERREVIEAILAMTQKSSPEPYRAIELIKLASHMSESERDEICREALAIIWKIESDHDRANTLSEIASHLSKPLLWGALSATQRIQNAQHRVKALIGLIPHLQEPLLQRALVMAQQIGDEKCRLKVLSVLTSYLSEPERTNVLQDISSIVQRIRKNIGPFSRRTDMVRTLEDLAPYLVGAEQAEVLQEALSLAQGDLGWMRIGILRSLAIQLAKLKYPQDALAVVKTIELEHHQAEALIELASHLQEEAFLREALAIALAIKDENNQAKALIGLTPYLPSSERVEILQKAPSLLSTIRDEKERVEALAKLASCRPKLTNDLLYPLWRETLPVLARRARWDLLNDLHALPPVIAALGGAEAIEETFHAIQDVGRWWP